MARPTTFHSGAGSVIRSLRLHPEDDEGLRIIFYSIKLDLTD